MNLYQLKSKWLFTLFFKNIRLVELYKLNGGHIADQPTQIDFQPYDNEEWKSKLENEDVNYFIDLYCKLIKWV